MELNEFMSIRRAYNVVRKDLDHDNRLTFEEFAILCRLDTCNTALKTSEIAEYQGSLRPTMTHRTNHLEQLGFIEREEGAVDRRNVVCSITPAGRKKVEELSALTRGQIAAGRSLSRTSVDRIRKYVDAMGAVYCKASDLVLLGLYSNDPEEVSIMSIVDSLGLLQPTVSMSVANLSSLGLIERDRVGRGRHTAHVHLNDKGREAAREIVARIERLVVRRSKRDEK